ncbi:E3 ubiquitin-protein ligase HERC2 [Sarcoptes scabiei]|uniref:Williams-Beuren syndrome chromosomal region 16 -like protein n=1 Tax=Sarcoptes scabiei TaxID=52283 RepID=A0A834REV2_SARSC|nr:E3 ubiquitin-protein ligase HERC2 [Sarcoptes scabiei]UXI19736.1 Serine/threonine-protein kinase PAK 3 [Sarcoptes scabiei]
MQIHFGIKKITKKFSIFKNGIRSMQIYRSETTNDPQIDGLEQFTQKNISSGEKNSLFAWGFSATGALGNENLLKLRKEDPPFPRKVIKRFPRRMKFFNPKFTIYDGAAGNGFTVIAATYRNSSHTLFGCGLNTDSQIGFQSNRSNEPLVCVANLVPIDLPLEESNVVSKHRPTQERVVKVACGRAHTICLTSHDNVFTMGNNSFGQCARPIVENEKYFGSKKISKIDYDHSDPIVQIECGLDHSLFLTASGVVYSCGLGCDGQLGNGSFKISPILTKVQGDILGEKIISISSAADCVLALNDKGQIFGWGNSEYGQLASATDNAQVNVSRQLFAKNQQDFFVNVAASGSMCALSNRAGRVCVWGYGFLGLGPNVKHLRKPTELSPILFGSNDFKQTKIIKLFAGLNQFGAINDLGELFMWGVNNRGNLGIGSVSDISYPHRVPIAESVLKLSLGLDHSIAITKKLM